MDPDCAISRPGLILGRREADALRRGIPELDLSAVPAGRDLPAGAAATLADGRGRPLGAAVADPDRGVLRVWSRSPIKAFDGAFFLRRIDEALERRKSLLGSPGTDAYRLIHGDGEGLGGLNVDAWAGYLVVEAYGRGPARWAPVLEEALRQRLRPRGIIEKLVLPEGGPEMVRGKAQERLVWGEAPPAPLVVQENGVPFAVRLLGARHEGLFTDMRDERIRLAGLAAGRRVLNTFAYTGSFSVVAARGGAAEVTTVDIVAKVLEWAKENFRLSGIDPGRHHFARMDTGEFLALALRRGWSWDIIVLDPPTSAVTAGRRWSLRKDYPALIGDAARVLAPGGILWVAANTAGLPEKDLDRWISEGSEAAGRRLRALARSGQPLDHPVPSGFPRYGYLKVRVMQDR